MRFVFKTELLFVTFLIKNVRLFLIKRNCMVNHECDRWLVVGFSVVPVIILFDFYTSAIANMKCHWCICRKISSMVGLVAGVVVKMSC